MPDPTCHYCTRPAEQECHQCGRLYCGMHGEDVCLRCLAPESATPSALAYRGSLLALAVGTLLAIFLLLRPPQSDAGEDTVRTIPTVAPSPSVSPTPAGAATTTARTATPGGAASVVAATASATATAASRTHTVQSGESLSGIAAAEGITLAELEALNPGVSAESLQPGQALILPPAR